MLDEMSQRSVRFFWEESDPVTGLTRDLAPAEGGVGAGAKAYVGSTGATGFGLTAVCIGSERGWIPRREARERVRAVLRSYVDGTVYANHGWFYHFVDVRTGARAGTSEMSTSDCTWLAAGALTARHYFREDPEIARLATRLYEGMDFPWMCNGDPMLLSHGWRPEGFIAARYDTYCQLACMYLLGMASPTHPLPPGAWRAWKRNPREYKGFQYIGTSLLWTYQYPFAWFDVRNRCEAFGTHVDYFENSATATRAHRAFCLDLAARFPGYTGNLWGITSSLSSSGYRAWGGPPAQGRIDGTVVPCAAAGSLMFTPELSLAALRSMKAGYGDRIYRRYGFVDAFNPGTGWVSDSVIGIDVGITLLAAENLRSGNVWNWFMANPEAQRAMELAQLQPTGGRDGE
jgi:hypothetical protein